MHHEDFFVYPPSKSKISSKSKIEGPKEIVDVISDWTNMYWKDETLNEHILIPHLLGMQELHKLTCIKKKVRGENARSQ